MKQLALALLLCMGDYAYAEDETVTILSFSEANVSSDEIVNGLLDSDTKADNLPKGLLPGSGASNHVSYRGIVIKRPKNEQISRAENTEETNAGHACPTQKKGIAISINFALDSYRIEDNYRDTLTQVAKAMNHEKLLGCGFVIEGHTDSIGDSLYNMDLSRKRANSVKEYLVSQSVSPSRLVTIGKGESEPLDANNTSAAINRRVQFMVNN